MCKCLKNWEIENRCQPEDESFKGCRCRCQTLIEIMSCDEQLSDLADQGDFTWFNGYVDDTELFRVIQKYIKIMS